MAAPDKLQPPRPAHRPTRVRVPLRQGRPRPGDALLRTCQPHPAVAEPAMNDPHSYRKTLKSHPVHPTRSARSCRLGAMRGSWASGHRVAGRLRIPHVCVESAAPALQSFSRRCSCSCHLAVAPPGLEHPPLVDADPLVPGQDHPIVRRRPRRAAHHPVVPANITGVPPRAAPTRYSRPADRRARPSSLKPQRHSPSTPHLGLRPAQPATPRATTPVQHRTTKLH